MTHTRTHRRRTTAAALTAAALTAAALTAAAETDRRSLRSRLGNFGPRLASLAATDVATPMCLASVTNYELTPYQLRTNSVSNARIHGAATRTSARVV